ncbi:DUF6361 family protein [Comamonas testosteroni]|uniref:DUF6361 family protein n=1 Tax=Comamonas testosteroni TaxID=285 RepID=UPI00391B1289
MPVAWLDFSSEQRDLVLDALVEPKDKGTLDELGFGTVRDAIADRLFPAISTIQTRAKYLLFVPWIFKAVADGTTSASRLRREAENRERALIGALIEGVSVKERGLIGRESKETLQRMPSSVYWGSLRQLKIFRGESSMAEYFREIESLRESKGKRYAGLQGDEDERQSGAHLAWDPALPEDHAVVEGKANFKLSSDEALYLAEKFLQLPTVPGQRGLLQWLAQDVDAGTFARANCPWDLLTCYGDAMPLALRRDLEHAWNFALCVQGCNMAYYYFLLSQRGDEVDGCITELEKWADALASRAKQLQAWHQDIDGFWSWVAQVNPKLSRDKPFINFWLSHLAETGFSLKGNSWLLKGDLKRRIKQREWDLKTDLARLSNPAPLKRWEAVDVARIMNFRWDQAKQILTDIHQGVNRKEVVNA